MSKSCYELCKVYGEDVEVMFKGSASSVDDFVDKIIDAELNVFIVLYANQKWSNAISNGIMGVPDQPETYKDDPAYRKFVRETIENEDSFVIYKIHMEFAREE